MLDVAVVIPNLNGENVLSACLGAVPAAAGAIAWEIVVVDNASRDGSVEYLERSAGIRLIRHEENLGFATACNHGGKSLESRYVLLLNNDVVLSLGALERMVQYGDRHEKVGAVTPLMCWPDGRIQGPRLGLFANRHAEAVPMSWAPGTCLLLRREALDAIGWLDEAFFFYNEDLDLSWRLRQAGWKIVCMPGIRVNHQEGASTRSNPEIRARAILEGYRGSVLLAKKHYAWALWLVRLGLRLDVEWQALKLSRRRGTLVEREEALQLCLPELRRSLAGSRD